MTPDEADANLAGTLEALESARNYADWILELLEPHLGTNVLEVGAGHGTLTERLARGGRHVTVSEISPRCVATLSDRFGGRPDVAVFNGDLGFAASKGPFDSVAMVNVLEHIEDDLGALVALREALRPGGRLLVFVPAFTQLYSRFDRLVGHHRRYSKPALRATVERAGFDVMDLRYVNALGGLTWWLFARQLGVVPRTSRTVWAYDRIVTPIMRRVESRLRLPFGQSAFCVARKVGD